MNDLGGADDPEPGPQAESAEDAEPSPGTEVAVDVDEAAAGMRLDQFLVRALPGRSRSFLARAIEKSAVRVDGVVERASHKLRAGACVRFTVPEPPRAGPVAEEIPLVFLHVDEWIAVVDKPPGMVVHPAKGNWKGTLAGALKWHLGGAAGEGAAADRQGRVERLRRSSRNRRMAGERAGLRPGVKRRPAAKVGRCVAKLTALSLARSLSVFGAVAGFAPSQPTKPP
jgi:23S rRNA pseudouridine1911/1915/1917 synthase